MLTLVFNRHGWLPPLEQLDQTPQHHVTGSRGREVVTLVNSPLLYRSTTNPFAGRLSFASFLASNFPRLALPAITSKYVHFVLSIQAVFSRGQTFFSLSSLTSCFRISASTAVPSICLHNLVRSVLCTDASSLASFHCSPSD
jgi:hypothetical protein